MAGGGFGFGGFGLTTFGQDSWAMRVLYRAAPELYRQQDALNGDLLRKYAEGQAPSFERLRELIQNYGDLRNPFRARTAYSDSEFVTLGKQVVPLGDIEQSGVLGQVNAVGAFTALDRTTSFGQQDIGKLLLIRRSNVAANNLQVFTITNVVNAKTVLTDPRTALDNPSVSGHIPIRWELRSPASLPEGQIEVELRGGDPRHIKVGWFINDGANNYEIVSRQMFWQSVTSNQLLTEREATDGSIDVEGRLGSDSYQFQYGDVGKLVTINNSTVSGNDGVYEIAAVEAGRAVFSQLSILGAPSSSILYPSYGPSTSGKTVYRYKAGVRKLVSVEHVWEHQALLPLEVTQTQVTPDSFNVRVRLATDVHAKLYSTPSEVAAAIANDPEISAYIEAIPAQPPSIFIVGIAGEFPQTLIPPYRPKEDNGPFYWALRPFARLTLRGPTPLGVVDGEGYDLQGDWVNRVRSTGSPFKEGDVGKLLTIRGSAVGNDGTYRISAYIDPETVELEATLSPEPATNMYWCRRTAPQIRDDPTRLNPQDFEVRAYAEPLLDYLAQDFGISVDRQQTDLRQRSNVRQVSQWTATKGTTLSVQQIALLNGFSAEVNSLASASAKPAMGDAAHPLPYEVFFIPYTLRSGGTAGSLTQEAGLAYYSDPAGLFLASDVGKVIKIDNSAGGGVNDNYFVIAEFVSSSKVRLLEPSIGASFGAPVSFTFPEANNGSLKMVVGEVYSDILPAFAAMDDIEWDSLAEMYDTANYDVNDRPGIDFPCDGLVSLRTVVGPDFVPVTSCPIKVGYFGSTLPSLPEVPSIVSLDPSYGLKIDSAYVAGTQITLTISGQDLRIVKNGEWKLVDANGESYYFDQPPTLLSSAGNWLWTVQIEAFAAPALGNCHIEYICTYTPSCGFCPTHKVVIELTATSVLAEGSLATERMFERCVAQIRQVLPAEAEVYWVYKVPFATAPAVPKGVTGEYFLF